MNEQDIEQLQKSLVQNTLVRAFRVARKLGWRAVKIVVKKILPVLLSWLAPLAAPVLVSLLLFTFVFGAFFVLPRYIMTGGTAPNKNVLGVLQVEVTGYTADYASTGKNPGDPGFGITATGAPVARGVVAVDPTVIPYGTRMYVPGYGAGIALDCGGAVKGNRIDLYFDSAEEAQNWGKQYLTIELEGSGDIPKNATEIASATGALAVLSFGNQDTQWSLSKDQKLYKTYLDIDSAWLKNYESSEQLSDLEVDSYRGNAASEKAVEDVWGSWMDEISSESEQVYPYRVPWSLLAAMDKVIGDPTTHGDHGLESEGHGRKPDPNKHFKELCPVLKWQTFQLYYYRSWTETSGNGESETYTEEYTKNIRLLTSASCYDASYQYTWKSKTIDQKTETSTLKVVYPEVASLIRTGPYYEKLKTVLESYDLNSDMNLEFVLEVARALDQTFYVDSWLFGTPLEIGMNTEYGTGLAGKFAIWPATGPITSPFGMRYHSILHKVTMHTGIDIGASYGTPVKAVKDGTVVFTGDYGAYGNAVMIDHSDCRTLYAHLSRILVHTGQQVKTGDEIGKVGSTGLSTGAHLHFEVRVGSNRTEYMNPMSNLP